MISSFFGDINYLYNTSVFENSKTESRTAARKPPFRVTCFELCGRR